MAVTADGRISVDWSLEPGDETWQVEISRSPSTDEEGAFKSDLLLGTNFAKTQRSWTSPRPFNRGTYYVHVGAWDEAANIIWTPTTQVTVSYALRSRWFQVEVVRKRNAAHLYFDGHQCRTMNDNPPTIPATVTIRSSWRNRPLRLNVGSVCAMDDLGFRTYFGGYISGSLSFVAWYLEPRRFFSEDGTWVEKLTIAGRVRGRPVGRHVLSVRHSNQVPKRIWEGTDAFVNYCINEGRTIRSEGGRLYCETKGRYSVKVTKLR